MATGVRPRATPTPAAVAPPAVARRNARERNRVKQVNDGFAALRQHIPASASDSHQQAKKLSKVETLRLAVDYIRRLQALLDVNDDDVVKDNDVVKEEEDDEDSDATRSSSSCHYSVDVDVMGCCWWP